MKLLNKNEIYIYTSIYIYKVYKCSFIHKYSTTYLKRPEHRESNDIARVVLELFVPANLDDTIEQVAGKADAPHANEHGHH